MVNELEKFLAKVYTKSVLLIFMNTHFPGLQTQKVIFSIPVDIVREFKKYVPRKNWNRIISQAMNELSEGENKLRLSKLCDDMLERSKRITMKDKRPSEEILHEMRYNPK